MSALKYSVLVGPQQAAQAYADSMGWAKDSYLIASEASQLIGLDPTRILCIVTVALSALAQAVVDEIEVEINKIQVLWPITVMSAQPMRKPKPHADLH